MISAPRTGAGHRAAVERRGDLLDAIRGDALRVPRRVRCGGRVEPRGVAALVHPDHDGIALPGPGVVLRQLGPQAPRLDAHDRVDSRIVVRGPVEHLGPEAVLLELIALAVQRALDDEAQEAAQASGVGEPRAGEDPFQLPANRVDVGREAAWRQYHPFAGLVRINHMGHTAPC